jgi:hypothetical protein
MNTIHKGSLIIDRRNMRDFAHITEVTGDLSIRAEGAALPVLRHWGAGHHAPSRAKCFTEVIAERIAAVEAV